MYSIYACVYWFKSMPSRNTIQIIKSNKALLGCCCLLVKLNPRRPRNISGKFSIFANRIEVLEYAVAIDSANHSNSIQFKIICLHKSHSHTHPHVLEHSSVSPQGVSVRSFVVSNVNLCEWKYVGANNWGNLNLYSVFIKHWGIKLQKFTDWIMQRVCFSNPMRYRYIYVCTYI